MVSDNNGYEQHLSIEDQFSIASFNAQADKMTREQAIDFLKRSHRLLVATKRLYLMECARNLPVFANESNKGQSTEKVWYDGSPD